MAEVLPDIQNMLATIGEIRESPQTAGIKGLQDDCKTVEKHLSNLVIEMRGLTDLFRLRTQGMWETISLESFQELKSLVQSFQTEVGGNLCIAVVKAKAWARRFPTAATGGLAARARIMTSEIRPGIERMAHFDYGDISFWRRR
jgi:hypothetical protein